MEFPFKSAAAALAAALLCGCGVSLWPFGESDTGGAERKPANATEYRCAVGRGFFVRALPDGAVWAILPDREVRLAKLEGGEGRYGAGRVLLEIDGAGATLTDPPATYSGCKRADAAAGN